MSTQPNCLTFAHKHIEENVPLLKQIRQAEIVPLPLGNRVGAQHVAVLAFRCEDLGFVRLSPD